MTKPNDPCRPAIVPEDAVLLGQTHFIGMTKREEFAKAAMAGFIAGIHSINFPSPADAQSAALWALDHIPDAAVAYADRLIVALNKSDA